MSNNTREDNGTLSDGDAVDMDNLLTPPDLEELEYQERKALRDHEELLRAKEANPDDPDLKKLVDEAYDSYCRIRRQIEAASTPAA